MGMAGLADNRRLVRSERQAIRPEITPKVRRARAARRPQRTGFEPFLIAAVLGLGLWALILTPVFLYLL